MQGKNMRFLLALLALGLPASAAAITSLPPQRLWLASGMLLAYALLCLRIWYLHRRQTRARQRATQTLLEGDGAANPILVAYASQTGQAEQIALQTARALQSSGGAVRFLPLANVTHELLAETRHALFVVSTTGEGDAPDNALGFVRQVMSKAHSLPALHYGLLALGDKDYQSFCAFGRELDMWLRLHGAQPLFNVVEVNQMDALSLDLWNLHLTQHFDANNAVQVDERPWQALQLLSRRCLNPGSQGLPGFHIELGGPALSSLHWASGDILEIMPRQATSRVEHWLQSLPWPGERMVTREGHTRTLKEWLSICHAPALSPLASSPEALVATLKPLSRREYSIASLPSEGKIMLLVRQTRTEQGELGQGSGWLTQWQQPGESIEVRLRANPGFRLPDDDRPLIFIGNGTGLAGLRSHLQARIKAGHHRNWLLFGERQLAHDFFYGEEIRHWQQQGFIEKLDLAFSRDNSFSRDSAFSRDNGKHRYVQDCLRDAETTLRQWLDDGASIYVCGSLEGMAAGVDAVLRDALGEEALEALVAEKRYCRDVY